MPRDGFYEESAISSRSQAEEKLYTTFKVFAIIFFIIGGFILTFAFAFVPNVLQGTVGEDGTVDTLTRIFALVEYFLAIAALIGAGLIFWFFKNRFNLSYDYTFVEDEIRITKVFNGKKRKFLYTIKADRILAIGWVESDAFERATRGFNTKKIKKCTPNKECPEGKEWIYITQSTSLEKAIYVLECRRQLLENIVFAAGRNKLEKK